MKILSRRLKHSQNLIIKYHTRSIARKERSIDEGTSVGNKHSNL